MPFKIFHNIKYPIPGVDTALEILRPGCRWSLQNNKFDGWEDDISNRNPPTWEELQKEIEREQKIYDYYEYERDRENAYPHPIDQLDMLFHDIENGNLQNGLWIQSIRKVKEKFPKPKINPPM